MHRISFFEPVVMLATVVQWLVLATITGTLVGVGTSAFLHALAWSTGATSSAPVWVYMLLLPLGGLLNGLLLYWGYRANDSQLDDSTLVAVHQQAGRMPLKTSLIKPVAALITLGSGGSAGKEGPCCHVGGSVAAGVGRILRLNSELRKRLVACGISAGFAGVFGTPIAGALYGVEILAVGRLRHDFLFPAIVAGVAAFEISQVLHVPYQYYAIAVPAHFSEIVFIKTVILGIACGVVSWVFVYSLEKVRRLFNWIRSCANVWPPLMPTLGGVVLACLITVIPTDYLGLGLPLMDRALDGEAMPYFGFLWKTLLVAITLGSGFYGGVVTPQFVIGAITGNALAHLLGLDPSLGAAIGLVSVVAAASGAPLAAVLMGVELFGQMIGTIYVAGAVGAAYLVIGHRSVYPNQMVAFAKSSWIHARPGTPLQQGSVHLSYGLRRWLGRRNERKRDR